jgi:hypothetical protein
MVARVLHGSHRPNWVISTGRAGASIAGGMSDRNARSGIGGPGTRMLVRVASFGPRAAAATVRPVAGVATGAVRKGLKVERRSRTVLTDAARRTALAGLDSVLASPHAEEVLQRLLAGPVTERAVGVALQGPLIDAVARDIARYDVLDRVVVQMLDARALEDVLVGDAVERVLDGAELEQLVAAFFESGLLDIVINRLLESDALWRLVEEVADSPAVTAAITQQSFGFADQIGDVIRRRSRNADAWLERRARRAARRHPAAPSPDDRGAPAGEAP